MRRGSIGRPVRRPWGTAVLSAEGLTVAHGPRTILRAVELRVVAGEVVALVGPNGAGKSTLLRALSGDQHPAAGSVLLDGRPLEAWSSAERARRRAVLPQQVAVAFPFTVEQIVRMGRAPWASTSGSVEDDAAVRAAMATCDVRTLADRSYPTLSGGEQARVSLARILAQGAQVLLLDEPTAALDIRHQEHVLRVLRSRAASGDAVVVVLHDLTAAAAHADRVVLLHAGSVVTDGPPAVALRPEVLASAYEHAVEVITSPDTGALAVLPVSPGSVALPRPAATSTGAAPTGATPTGVP